MILITDRIAATIATKERIRAPRQVLLAEGNGVSEHFDPDSSGRDFQSIGVASSLGFGIALSLALLVGGGVWLDTRFDTTPVWTLIGLVLGMVAAGYQLYELVLVSRKDKQNGPLGRKLTSRRSK